MEELGALMKFFNVCSIEEAKKRIKEAFGGFELLSEKVSLLDSFDRYNYMDIKSDELLPQFNRSTVDGYAIKSTDSYGCSDTMQNFLRVVGEIEMGMLSNIKINEGEAVYVPTGGMVPDGADSVIMIEHIEKVSPTEIAINKPVAYGNNIIFMGDDIKPGDMVVQKGRKINTADIGKLAALGIYEINVYKKMSFSIISTGDEIVDIDKKPGPGEIRDINGYVLHAIIKEIGGVVKNRVIAVDDYNILKKSLEDALEISDIVLISGGSSVGEKDYTKSVIAQLEGRGVFVEGISIKPGKPTIIGESKNKLIFGLPGHPVSAIIVFKVFIDNILK
jgi:molybdopterin molybdotransferase